MEKIGYGGVRISSYVTLNLRTNVYGEIIDALMTYCSKLDNYWDMEECVHIIDSLEELYQEDMVKQNKDYEQWREYEKLFNERFKNNTGNLNNIQIDEYKNFHKVNRVIEEYKEGGVVDVLDVKQQFCLVLDLINSMGEWNE